MKRQPIFVSHSHEDNSYCRELVAALRAAGADVWYDEQNLGSGRLLLTIERELRARPIFVVILSPAALASDWVRDESSWAYTLLRREPQRVILPVLARPIDATGVWMFLQDFKRIEAPGGVPLALTEAARQTLRALTLSASDRANEPADRLYAGASDDPLARAGALCAQSARGGIGCA